MRARLAVLLEREWLLVGFLFALTAAATTYYATRVTTFQPDSLGYTRMAIDLGRHPSLHTTAAGGGDRVNQLYPLALAPLYRLFGNTTAFTLSHVLNALLMTSAIFPAYLLAKEVLGPARRTAALICALLVAVLPWLTMAAVQLTEVMAYPAAMWALWAMQRAMDRPSPRWDLIALAVIGVTTYARLQLLILAPVFVVAVLVHELAYALGAPDRRAGLREARDRLLRGHVVLAAAAAVGLLVGIPLLASGKLADLFGFYGNTISGPLFPPGTWDGARSNLVFLAVGVGFLPAMLCLGLVADVLVGRGERPVHAFAILAAVSIAAVVVQVGRINVVFNGAVVQERYVMFVAPLLAIGGVVAVAAARRPWLCAVAGAAVLVPLFGTVDYATTRTAFWYLVSPGLTTWFDVIGPRAAKLAPLFGDDYYSRFAIGAYVAAVAAVVLAVLLRRVGRDRVLAGLAVLVGVFCALETVHAFNRVLYGHEAEKGLADGSYHDANWIDNAIGKDGHAALLARQVGPTSTSRGTWWTTEFWNRSVGASYALAEPFTTWNSARPVSVRPRTGRLPVAGAARYVVQSSTGVPVGLAGRIVARSPDRRLQLVDTGGALRARWAVTGISDDGWLPVERPATLTVYAGAPGCRSVALTLAGPADLTEGRTVVLQGPGVDVRRAIGADAAATLRTRVCASAAGPVRLRMHAAVPTGTSFPGVTVQLRDLSVA